MFYNLKEKQEKIRKDIIETLNQSDRIWSFENVNFFENEFFFFLGDYILTFSESNGIKTVPLKDVKLSTLSKFIETDTSYNTEEIKTLYITHCHTNKTIFGIFNTETEQLTTNDDLVQIESHCIKYFLLKQLNYNPENKELKI